jgi:integrase
MTLTCGRAPVTSHGWTPKQGDKAASVGGLFHSCGRGDRLANAVLTVAELCDLRWDQVEFNAAVLHVRRVKNGTQSTHPILGDEMRALRRLQREGVPSPFVF